MSRTRTDYYAQYYEKNKDIILEKRNIAFLEKKVLNQLDKYFVNKSLLSETEKDLFAAKEIALCFRILHDTTIDYELIYESYKDFALISTQAIKSSNVLTLDIINSRKLILAKFYEYMATRPEFKKYKSILETSSMDIITKHKKDLQTQEMLNKGNQ